MQLARDIAQSRVNAMLFDRMREVARQIVALTEDASQLAPVEGLTKHELRILALFARGGSSVSIAHKLDISAQTLRNHLHRINRKLGTNSRLAAVTHAQRRGLIA